MKKPIKLSKEALHRIIVTEVKKTTQRITEASRAQDQHGQASYIASNMAATGDGMVEEVLSNMYDEGDPSMNHVGPQAWQQQCREAATDFMTQVEPLLEEAAEEMIMKLIDGQYYRE